MGPHPLESCRVGGLNMSAPREEEDEGRDRRRRLACSLWFFIVWLGHVHVYLLYLQNPKCRPRRIPTPTLPVHTEYPRIIPSTSTRKSNLRSHSRRETWHIGYAHACGPEGARETDHSTLVRYTQIQVQEECEMSSSLSWVWGVLEILSILRDRGQQKGKMRR